MREGYLVRGGLLLMAVLLLFMGGSRAAYGQEGEPDPHEAISEYIGPETCASCHLDDARQVAESLHYQQQGQAPYREGWEEDKLGGMYVTY